MFNRKMHVRWNRSVAKTARLDCVCTKDQQIEVYRTLYAKAAKERDEAYAENRKLLNELLLAKSGFEL